MAAEIDKYLDQSNSYNKSAVAGKHAHIENKNHDLKSKGTFICGFQQFPTKNRKSIPWPFFSKGSVVTNKRTRR